MKIVRNFKELLDKRLANKLNNIQIVSGPRQVGKTTGIQQILDEWQDSKLYLTSDNQTKDSHWIEANWRKALTMPEPTLLVFDEIQKIPNWNETIKYFFDQVRGKRDLRIVLLGSASNLLEKGYSESLAGRFELIKVFHWNFRESKEFFNWDLNTYLKYGGYPEASKLVSDKDRWKEYIFNSIITPIISKDILSTISVMKPALFKQTFELAMQYPAMEISLQKLLGQLQDKGNAATIKHYLNLFENAYLLKTLDKYSGSLVKQKSSSPKIIPLCPALITVYSDPDLIDSDLNFRGRVLEAAIGSRLSQSNFQLYYWREGNHEVDYVIKYKDKLFAIEIKSGRKKFTTGMQKFLKKYPKAIPAIINQENSESFLLEENVFDSLENGKY